MQREADALIVFKEFASSILLMVSWFIFAISAYLLYWTIVMPLLAIIPFLISLSSGLLCFTVQENLTIEIRQLVIQLTGALVNGLM